MTDAEKIENLEQQVRQLQDAMKLLGEFNLKNGFYKAWLQAYTATHMPTDDRVDTPETEHMLNVLQYLGTADNK
ncbi:hypothetical protein FV222_01500 [Methylobacterium sp. WL103]|uniref:hypothetical protein n=1 Tax=Methylobacterium sp. WL103 TaxID=2603891 RepID=UPI0011C7CCA8|nr:hypothetical protein [Methylobacterium sp. WL103]TXN07938.1 hypothetical protein FV222_01500 [Methylobacterium sp. WL103]